MPDFGRRGVITGFTLLVSLVMGAAVSLALDWQLESSTQGDIPLPNLGNEQTANLIGDIDGNGLDDVVIAERTAAPAVVVYFREDGVWTREVIEAGLLTVEAGGTLYDVDSDDDLDIVHGSDYQSNEVWWWENPGSRPYLPAGWTRHLIKNTGANQHHDMVFGDFDGDGVDEFAFWNQEEPGLFLAEVPADPRTSGPWPRTLIFSGSNRSEGLIAVDVNTDGKIDLCGGGYWFEHVSGTEFVAWPVVNESNYIRVAAGQLVPGGRPELVVSSGDAQGRLSWVEWDGNVWNENILDPAADHAHSLEIGDVDHDGRLDIFSAEMHTPGAGANARSRVFLNRGSGVFEAEEVSVGIGNHESKLVDLDGDGWLDIMGKPLTEGAPGLNAWLQTPGFSDVFSLGEPCMIGPDTGLEARAVHAVDVDSDGLMDLGALLAGAATEARYYRAPTWDSVLVASADLAAGAWIDIDRDGDLDLLAVGAGETPDLVWFANPADGSGNWSGTVIRSYSESVEALEISDLEDDGLTDLVLFTATSIEIVTENGMGGWSASTISNLADGNGGWVADIDRDGARDVGRSGRWWRNPGGLGSWTERLVPGGLGTDAVSWTADLDRDGWSDLITLDQAGNGDLVFHANNRLGDLQAGYLLGGVGLADAKDLVARDFDADGDLDLVVSGRSQAGGPLAVLARSGGQPLGSWTMENAALATSVAAADIDLDGEVDLVLGDDSADPGVCTLGLGINQTTTTWTLTGWQRHLLDGARPGKAFFVLHGDFDRDGWVDVVAGAFWYQNPGSPDGVWVRRAFGSPLANVAAVHDFDRDGDLDVLGTEGVDSSPNPDFVWARNDGIGNFTIYNNVPSGTGSFLQGVAVGRFGLGGGSSDASLSVALSWEDPLSGFPDGIDLLTVPADPVNEPWVMGTLFPDSENEALSARDIDRDGDIDLALGRSWLRNDGLSWSQFQIASPSEDPDRNLLVDMNADGRLDLLIGFEAVNRTGPVRWYEQPPVPTSMWGEHDVTNLTGPMSVDAGDLDRDGDLDLVVGEHYPSSPQNAGFFVVENGSPDFWTDHLIHDGDEHHDGTQLVDIDGDGDLDVISVGYVSDDVVLYENLAIGIGGVSDVIPPVLTSAQAWVENRVLAEFSERVDLATATDPTRYTIDPPVSILAANLLADQRTVELQVTPLQEGEDYNLAAGGVLDLASPPNGSDGFITVPFNFVPPQRVSAGLVALYEFSEGTGNLVADVSGVGTPLDLTIGDPGAVTWQPGGGLSLNTATIVSSESPATKVTDAVTATNEITVEAWLAPANVAQNGPARIVTCSADPSLRNFTLGHGVSGGVDDSYVMRLRTTATNDNGEPETPTAGGSLTTALTHVVYTRSATNAVSIYLDGVLAKSDLVWGTCENWDPSYALALGNELSEDRPWLGTYYLVAAYDRALTLSDIQQNFIAGPQGETPGSAPVITSTPVTTATVNQPYAYQVMAQGFPAPAFSLSVMPAGMTIDSASGVISWTPGILGDHTVEVIATNSEGSDSQNFLLSVYPDNPVQIAVWHGLDQRIGHLGSAQADFNVLGNISPVAEVSSLAYKLNGGVFQDLTIGPDDNRLADIGDFNADVPISLLQIGPNTLTIQALDTTGQPSTVVVNITLERGDNYALPATLSWNNVATPQDVGQYVDGQWQLQGDALRVMRPGYNRIFLIGDKIWQDYEILVPITINGVLEDDAGLGFIMRFTGHIIGGYRNWPDAQPKWGYQPFGGIGWLRWAGGPTNDPTVQFYYGDFDTVDDFGPPAKALSDQTTIPFGAPEMTKNFGKVTTALGNSYMMRMRCETQPDAPDGDGVTLYSWKIWDAGTVEPTGWSFQVTQESRYALRQGGVGLVAHHVDANFGDVLVSAIDNGGVSDATPGAGDGIKRYALYQNHPNPFNPRTEIKFSLPHDTKGTLKIYNVRGQMVAKLADGEMSAGNHSLVWDARHLASGVYFYRLVTPDFNQTKKMIMLK